MIVRTALSGLKKTWILIEMNDMYSWSRMLLALASLLAIIYQRLEMDKPASLKICTLLDNPAERILNIPY
jgi:hypothetical protein